MGTLKEEITGFVAVGMDALKTPAMKICISEAFARDSRLALIRSPEQEAMVALYSLSENGPDPGKATSCEMSEGLSATCTDGYTVLRRVGMWY